MALSLRLPSPIAHSPPRNYITRTNSVSKKNTIVSFPDELSNGNRKLPILLFDIMDTIVRDPFYQDVPAFFRMTLEELFEIKHPTSWIEFEKGLIDEPELERKFFKDGRSFDLDGLKQCMVRGYHYIEGVEEVLCSLKANKYEMHAFTNYPIWCDMIEEKLNISRYMHWTFCSFKNGKRKPDPDSYLDVVKQLKVEPENCIFVDDRMKNVEAAKLVGMVGLQFKNADTLRRNFSELGIDVSKE